MSKKLYFVALILFLCSALVLYAGHQQGSSQSFEPPTIEISWEFGPFQSTSLGLNGNIILCDQRTCICYECWPNGMGGYNCTPTNPLTGCQ